MAAPQTAQEALRAWLSLLSPEERRAAESAMGATLPSSAQASDEPTRVTAPDEPTPSPSQADPSTTPIPEEPNSSLLAQREWYDSQDKIFQGLIPPETPWQDDLSAQPTSSASPQPTLNETSTEPQAPDQKPWLLPQPDTRLFNIFGDSFELQALKEKIAKGQMPPCLYKDPAAVDQQPLNRQELWAAMQYKPIYRTAGKWTYWDLLPDDIRKPPPQFCNEIEDAPKQPPASRLQPKEKARPKHVPPSARPNMPLNRLGRLRRTPRQMPQNRKRPPRLPQPPSRFGCDRSYSAAYSLSSRDKTRAPTPATFAPARVADFLAQRKPSPCPNLCPPSQPKPPSRLKVSRSERTVPARPRMTSRTYPPQTQPRSTSLCPDKTYTLMLFAAWISQGPSPSPSPLMSTSWTDEHSLSTPNRTTSL